MSAVLRSERVTRDELIQRRWELEQALRAAQPLQARLEMLGDRAADVAVIVSLRNSLARDLAGLTPQILLASDDVDDEGRPNEWNAAGLARAAGERVDE